MYPIVCGSLSEVGRNIKLEVNQEPVQHSMFSIHWCVAIICNNIKLDVSLNNYEQ